MKLTHTPPPTHAATTDAANEHATVTPPTHAASTPAQQTSTPQPRRQRMPPSRRAANEHATATLPTHAATTPRSQRTRHSATQSTRTVAACAADAHAKPSRNTKRSCCVGIPPKNPPSPPKTGSRSQPDLSPTNPRRTNERTGQLPLSYRVHPLQPTVITPRTRLTHTGLRLPRPGHRAGCSVARRWS